MLKNFRASGAPPPFEDPMYATDHVLQRYFCGKAYLDPPEGGLQLLRTRRHRGRLELVLNHTIVVTIDGNPRLTTIFLC